MARIRGARFSLIVFVVVVVLARSHVCVLPLHVYAGLGTADVRHDAGPRQGDDHHRAGHDEGNWDASCEAVLAQAGASSSALVDADSVPSTFAAVVVPRADLGLRTLPAPPSADLFLLHRVLLI